MDPKEAEDLLCIPPWLLLVPGPSWMGNHHAGEEEQNLGEEGVVKVDHHQEIVAGVAVVQQELLQVLRSPLFSKENAFFVEQSADHIPKHNLIDNRKIQPL